MASWPILSVVTFLPLAGALFIALLWIACTLARSMRPDIIRRMGCSTCRCR